MERAKSKVLFNKLWMGILLLTVMLMANMSVTANAEEVDDPGEEVGWLQLENYSVTIPRGQTFDPKMLGYSVEFNGDPITEGIDYKVTGLVSGSYDEDDEFAFDYDNVKRQIKLG